MKNRIILLLITGLMPIAMWAQPSKDYLKRHVTYLASEELEGRGLGTKGKDLATKYIVDKFQEAGLTPMNNEGFSQSFNIKADLAWVEASNIVGVIPGTDANLKNEYVVIGAHYDHLGYTIDGETKTIYPGADNNASGVSLLLELAFTLNKPENRQKRTIILIAFDAGESGLLGSKEFVEKLDANIKSNIKVMFSLDMIGMLGANNGLILKGLGGLEKGKELASDVASKQAITLLETSSNIEQRTDTKSFGDAGIPSIHVFTGMKSPYQRPEDTADLLDYAGMVKIHDFTIGLLNAFNDLSTLESSKTLKAKLANPEKITNRFQFGLIASLGAGQHLYTEEFFDAKTAFSYSVGLQFNYKLNKNFNIQLEGLYDHNAIRSADGRFRRKSLTVPVNFENGTSSYSGNDVRFFGFLGPYYRNNFDGRNGNTDLDFDNLYEDTEFGLSLGFGFDIQKFRIAYTYRQGFNSILTNNVNIIATGTYLTLGVRF